MLPHDEEFYHYGVRGMRWGVRRANRQLAKESRIGSTAWQKKNFKQETADHNKLKADFKSGKITKKEYKKKDLEVAMRMARKLDEARAAKMTPEMQTRGKRRFRKAFGDSLAGGGIGTGAAIVANVPMRILTKGEYSFGPIGIGILSASVAGTHSLYKSFKK